MSMILERLIGAATPLLTAVTGKKKANRPKRVVSKSSRAAVPRRKPVKAKPMVRRPVWHKKLPVIKLPVKSVQATESAALYVVPPGGRAILISPENGKYVDTLNPSFRWLSVGGATRYEIGWGEENHEKDSFLLISISTEAAVPIEKPLRVGVAYQWRVRGGNEAGWGPWSPPSLFRVVPEALPN